MIANTAIKETNNEELKYFLILNINYGNDQEEIKTEITYLDKKPEVIAKIIELLKR